MCVKKEIKSEFAEKQDEWAKKESARLLEMARNIKNPVEEEVFEQELIKSFKDWGRIGGRMGGSIGGKIRAEKLSKERRSEIARMGGLAKGKTK
jgi:hypothetical protein